MNTMEYKDALNQDIQKLKNVSLEIVPSFVFYKAIGLIVFKFYILVVGFPWIITILNNQQRLGFDFYIEDLFILSGLFLLFLLIFLPKIAEYVTIKNTILPILSLGKSIEKRIRLYFDVILGVSIIWSTCYSLFFFTDGFSHFGERMFTLLPGLILGTFIASILFQMELARIGLSTLYEVISQLRTNHK